MTPAQLTKALKQADLSQSEAARRLGIDPRTMRRYISGDLAITLVVELALRYVIEHRDDK
jgi:transcriptional regulator with XRE-family HTH domain